MNSQAKGDRLSKAKNIGLWALQVLTAAAFLMAGFAKLSGQPTMVEEFDQIGLGQWFRYLTGSIELVSALLLVIPRFTPMGAALLVCTMIGAVLTHLLKIGGSPSPALVLGCLAAIILWGRFAVLKAWLGKSSAPALPAEGSTSIFDESAPKLVNDEHSYYGGINSYEWQPSRRL
jgi:putative oxidoreductase